MEPIEIGTCPEWSPIDSKWTLSALLAWLGADDARCHDERLRGLLDTVEHALGSDAAGAPSTVMLVRSIAARVAAEPALGDLRLGELYGTAPTRALAVGHGRGVPAAPLLTA
jgi:hypothetical protein